jgi:hypothetical protein
MRKRNYTRYVGVMLSEVTYQKLISFTDKKEIPQSEFIRELIEEALQFKEKEKQDGQY